MLPAIFRVGDNMNSYIRLEAKELLSKNTGKLFFVAFFSFCLRYTAFLLWLVSCFLFLNSNIFDTLKGKNESVTIIAVVSIYFILLILCLVFSSAIKQGERFIYFSRAEGGKVRAKNLFKYLRPSLSLRAFALCLLVNIRKLFWIIYLAVPLIISAGSYLFVLKSTELYREFLFILSICLAIIIGLYMVMLKLAFARYSYAYYLFAVNPKSKTTYNIRKSLRLTDLGLCDEVLLEYSLGGWLLSCILIAPALYAVPYMKLTRACFVANIAKDRQTIHSRYAVNILEILPN